MRLLPSDSFTFELDTIYGDDGGSVETAFTGLRPSVTFNGGSFSVICGFEHVSYDDDSGDISASNGFALASSINIG